MYEKKIYAKTVSGWLTKEQISAEDLKRPDVSESINKNGYFAVSKELPSVTSNCLDELVTLGYVDRKKDTLYHVSYQYVVHPYHPFVLPTSGLGITNVTNNHTENVILNSTQYSTFRETANIFKNQMAAGNHLHVTQFEYSSAPPYESDIYEVKDKYFDAIFLTPDQSPDRLTVHLVEPFVETRKNKDKKNWRNIIEIDQLLFLNGAKSIDEEITSLEWKQHYIGIIIYKDKAYRLELSGAADNTSEESHEDDGDHNFLKMPDFLNVKPYSYGNMLSRIFEEAVKNFLNDEHLYPHVTTRYKPRYLRGLELDIYAEKGGGKRKIITVCECKFRLPSRSHLVTIDDLDSFKRKKQMIEENEKAHGDAKLNFWLVTNGDKFDKGVKEQAKSAGIEIRKAKLSKGWEDRADWKITEMKAEK
jgi:hypothetical protein